MTDIQWQDLKLNDLVIMSVTEDTIGICIPCLVILCRAWLSIMSVTYIQLTTYLSIKKHLKFFSLDVQINWREYVCVFVLLGSHFG